MLTYRFTDTPSAADIDAAAKMKLIPSGVRIYADVADYRARNGGSDNPAPAPEQYGKPKHWAYPPARYNSYPGVWFVFLDGVEALNALPPGAKDLRSTNVGLTNRETFGVLSQPNFYSTNAEHFPLIPRFYYQYMSNEEAGRLSIGELPSANEKRVPIAYLFEDEVGPIDFLDPFGRKASRSDGPTGFKFRSSFPSDVGLRVVADGRIEAFLIAEWKPAAQTKTFRSFTDAEQLEFLRFALETPGSPSAIAGKVRMFFER